MVTIKESLNCKPEFKIKFPLTSKSFPTVKLVSINTLPFTLNESLMVNIESNLPCPFTNKFESIFTLPLANIESDTYNLLLAKILCIILAPLVTIKESLNCKPEFKIKFPLTSKSFPTTKLVSINTLPFTLKVSFKTFILFNVKVLSIFTFPLANIESDTYNLLLANMLCSILAPFKITNESLNSKPEFNIKSP